MGSMKRILRIITTLAAALLVLAGVQVANPGSAQAVWAAGCGNIGLTNGNIVIPYNNTRWIYRNMIRFRAERDNRGYFTVTGISAAYQAPMLTRSTTDAWTYAGVWNSGNYPEVAKAASLTNSGQQATFYWQATCDGV
jgi:hypothetical protein